VWSGFSATGLPAKPFIWSITSTMVKCGGTTPRSAPPKTHRGATVRDFYDQEKTRLSTADFHLL
jgi:hypothetical protein